MSSPPVAGSRRIQVCSEALPTSAAGAVAYCRQSGQADGHRHRTGEVVGLIQEMVVRGAHGRGAQKKNNSLKNCNDLILGKHFTGKFLVPVKQSNRIWGFCSTISELMNDGPGAGVQYITKTRCGM